MQRKKSKAKATPSPPAPVGVDVDKDVVVRLAYELYVRRGGEHGHDVEDWLMAEQILLEQKKRSGSTRRASDATRRREGKFYS
jgi:hypothetical protein